MNLQKGPLGLLGAFSLKVLGRNPTQFGDTITPVADVYDQYLASGELQVFNTAFPTTLAAFNSTSHTVPTGKVWRVIGASFVGALNAADAALLSQMDIGIQSPNSAPQLCRVSTPLVPYASTNARMVSALFRPPIFLPSGWKIVFELWTSAAITVTSNIQATSLFQEFDT